MGKVRLCLLGKIMELFTGKELEGKEIAMPSQQRTAGLMF